METDKPVIFRYMDGFFYDLYNSCKISEISESDIEDAVAIHNTFQSFTGLVRSDSFTPNAQRVIVFEFHNLFLQFLYAYKYYCMQEMKKENGDTTNITNTLSDIISIFRGIAAVVRNLPDDDDWVRLESMINEEKAHFDAFIETYFQEPHEDLRTIIGDPPEEDEPEMSPVPSLEKELDDQELEQCIERCKLSFGYEQLHMFCVGVTNMFVFIGYIACLVRVMCAILSTSNDYALDIRFGDCLLVVIAIHIIVNSRTIYNYIRRFANG